MEKLYDGFEYAVSVVICTYGQAEYLPRLLDSVVNQKTNFKFEVMVDDDCSPDNTRQIILAYQEKYPDIIFPSLRDVNVRATKNQYMMLRRARGKYIATVDGDDYWVDMEKLQYQYDFMESHPEYICMYCNSMVITSLDGKQMHPRRDITEPMIFTYENWMNFHFFDRMPNSDDTLFCRNFFVSAPEEEVDIIYKAHDMEQDQTLALIFYGKGPVYVDPRIVSHHRSIVDPSKENFQSLEARTDNKVKIAYKYACQEDYCEKVLHRKCTRFLKVRAWVFAESFWIAMKSHKQEDWEKVNAIWNQRKKKWPLVWYTLVWGFGTLKRKIGFKHNEKKA